MNSKRSSSPSPAWKWRSSTVFIVTTITVALFADLFLYGFIVPILPYMLEERLGIRHKATQSSTSNLLAVYAAVEVISSPFIGIIADSSTLRRGPLIVGLAAALASTVLFAWSTQLYLLYLARIVQGLSATLIWVVGFATIADTVPTEKLGTTFGIITPFMNAGAFAGPMVSGILLQTVGYWATWSTAIAVLVVDIVLRFLMVENPRKTRTEKSSSPYGAISHCPPENVLAEAAILQGELEHAPLLSEHPRPSSPASAVSNESRPTSSASSPTHSAVSTAPSTPNEEILEYASLLRKSDDHASKKPPVKAVNWYQYYILLLSQRRYLASAFCTFTYSIFYASFEATLPLHVKAAFGWDSLPAGMMFLALQAPGIMFSPIAGWMRDRLGVRWPTTVGWLILTPFMFLCGVPGDPRFPWAVEYTGKALYVACMIAIGCSINLVTGAGTVESTLVVDELEAAQPGIFGPNGGYSRLYSLSSMTYTSGTLVGPELAGYMVNNYGYGNLSFLLAFMCIIAAGVSAAFIGPRNGDSKSSHLQDEEARVQAA